MKIIDKTGDESLLLLFYMINCGQARAENSRESIVLHSSVG